jgi:hypothetical protein
MGRREKNLRLADNKLKMAEYFTAKTWSLENRPFHLAYLAKKLSCPNQACSDSVSSYFLDGIDHHYRTIHKIKCR